MFWVFLFKASLRHIFGQISAASDDAHAHTLRYIYLSHFALYSIAGKARTTFDCFLFFSMDPKKKTLRKSSFKTKRNVSIHSTWKNNFTSTFPTQSIASSRFTSHQQHSTRKNNFTSTFSTAFHRFFALHKCASQKHSTWKKLSFTSTFFCSKSIPSSRSPTVMSREQFHFIVFCSKHHVSQVSIQLKRTVSLKHFLYSTLLRHVSQVSKLFLSTCDQPKRTQLRFTSEQSNIQLEEQFYFNVFCCIASSRFTSEKVKSIQLERTISLQLFPFINASLPHVSQVKDIQFERTTWKNNFTSTFSVSIAS